MADIHHRKDEHLDIALNRNVRMDRPNGFDAYQLIHKALPEIDLGKVSLATQFLGHSLSAPIMVASMTGGTERGTRINQHLAEAVNELGLAMSVGSQRVLLEHPDLQSSFALVRQAAHHQPLFGNIGAVQLNYGIRTAEMRRLAEAIQADGMFLHCNPLQEAIQPEGNTNFSGLLDKIGVVAQELPIPLLVKEVGAGIAPDLAAALVSRKVQGIDVSGAGGTSWAQIEGMRADNPVQKKLAQVFANWGISTADSLRLCREKLPKLPLIASGGIRNGIDAAKALVLGADLVALAHPLLEPASQSTAAVVAALTQFIEELRVAMFLVGAASIAELKQQQIWRSASYE